MSFGILQSNEMTQRQHTPRFGTQPLRTDYRVRKHKVIN